MLKMIVSEGWALYVLSWRGKRQLDAGKRIIQGPAMVFADELKKVYLIRKHEIYKEVIIPIPYNARLKELVESSLEESGKVKVTRDNSMFIYNLIFEKKTHFFGENYSQKPKRGNK